MRRFSSSFGGLFRSILLKQNEDDGRRSPAGSLDHVLLRLVAPAVVLSAKLRLQGVRPHARLAHSLPLLQQPDLGLLPRRRGVGPEALGHGGQARPNASLRAILVNLEEEEVQFYEGKTEAAASNSMGEEGQNSPVPTTMRLLRPGPTETPLPRAGRAW